MSIVTYRRELHTLAEGGFCEFETSKYIKRVLALLGCEIMTLGKTGLAAYFDFGKNKTVAFRAELDALPINEETGLEFAARTGYMHACGHDGHMAMLLELCEIISERNTAKTNVLAIFQPGEELFGGAESVIKTDIFKNIKVDEMYTIHLRPNLTIGELYSTSGVIYCGSSEFDIAFLSNGGHIDANVTDAIECAARTIIYIKDELCTGDVRAISGVIHGGAARNISAPRAEISGTLRYFLPSSGENAKLKLTAFAEGQKCACHVAIRDYAPPQNNSPELFLRYHINTLASPLYFADDFSHYSKVIPKTLYVLLGAGDVAPLHTSKFDFDENVLFSGVSFYKRILNI